VVAISYKLKGIRIMNKKAYIYIRNWDLREHNKEVLVKYNLEWGNYWYIGSTEETLETRTSKFRYQMLEQHKINTENSNNYENNKTKIFINKLVNMYKYEYKLNDNEIDKLVFNYFDTIEVQYIEYEYNNTRLYLHQLLEAKVIGQYITMSSFDKTNCVLSLKDTNITSTKTSVKIKNNKKFCTSPTITFGGQINNNTGEIISPHIGIPTGLQEIYESFMKSDIIRLEQDLDNKKIL